MSTPPTPQDVIGMIAQGSDGWDLIQQFLPSDWQDAAYTFGAFSRTRGIKDPNALLRLLMIHLSDGCSLKETVERARLGNLADVSAPSLQRRLEKCGRWLGWLAVHVRDYVNQASAVSMRDYPWNIRLVDATTIDEQGGRGTRYRLHYSLQLKSLNCDHFELTDKHGGESFRRFPVRKRDLLLGDRGYSHLPGISHVVDQGSDVLVRVNWASLRVEHVDGRRFDPLAQACDMKVGEVREWPVSLPDKRGKVVARGRIVAIRKSEEEWRRSRASVQKRCCKKGTPVSERALALAAYVFVFTTVPSEQLPKEHVLELYRGRWQVELGFKQLKSVLRLGNLPKRSEKACKAWLHGKLLVALLVQAAMQTGRLFSPWGYPIRLPTLSARKPMA